MILRLRNINIFGYIPQKYIRVLFTLVNPFKFLDHLMTLQLIYQEDISAVIYGIEYPKNRFSELKMEYCRRRLVHTSGLPYYNRSLYLGIELEIQQLMTTKVLFLDWMY